MGARLSEHELQKSLDFCVNLFSPTSPEQHDRVAQSGVQKELLDVNAPVVDPKVLEDVLNLQAAGGNGNGNENGHTESSANGEGLATILDNEIEHLTIDDSKTPQRLPPPVRTDARRMKRSDSDAEKFMVVNKINARRVVHSEYAINNLETENLNGFVVRLQQGNLGLMKTKSD